jgi:protein gp37
MSKIQWTDATLNPVVGCTRAGYQRADGRYVAHPGCDHCYAELMCSRALPGFGMHNECSEGGRWTGNIRVILERLTWPFCRKDFGPRRDGQQRRVFLTSLGDMGHPALPVGDWMAIQGMMAMSPWITWQDLTKRPERQAELLRRHDPKDCARAAVRLLRMIDDSVDKDNRLSDIAWSLQAQRVEWGQINNIHRYVSVSDQSTADALIPLLLEVPAKVRGISLEPMIGPVDLTPWIGRLQHVIVGGESGRQARHCATEWIHSVVLQCREAGVPCFVKQLGSASPLRGKDPKGGDPGEWPAFLQVRQHVGGGA